MNREREERGEGWGAQERGMAGQCYKATRGEKMLERWGGGDREGNRGCMGSTREVYERFQKAGKGEQRGLERRRVQAGIKRASLGERGKEDDWTPEQGVGGLSLGLGYKAQIG